MASDLVAGHSFETSHYVEVDDGTCCNVVVGHSEPNHVSLSSDSVSEEGDKEYAPQFYQCSDSDSDECPLLECTHCGSFFESHTYCP